MNRTKIEWVRNPDGSQGFTWNPIIGCSHGCGYCYARLQAYRARGRCEQCYQFVPHPHAERMNDPIRREKPSTIFLCSMGDLFCEEVEHSWIENVECAVEACPQHRFIVLTKNPSRAYYHSLPDMENVLFGISLDTEKRAREYIMGFKEAGGRPGIKIISFEPLLEKIDLHLEGLKWVIIGGQTRPNIYPEKEWVMAIIDEAKEHDVPIFMKANLGPEYDGKLIQEFPEDFLFTR